MTDVAERVIHAELERLTEAGKGQVSANWGYQEVRRIDAWAAFFVPGPDWICITGMLPDFSAYPNGITYTTSHPLLAISKGFVVERHIEAHAHPGGYVYSVMGRKHKDEHDREKILLQGYQEIGLIRRDGEWPVIDVTTQVARLAGREDSV